jgi:hypothetical protein
MKTTYTAEGLVAAVYSHKHGRKFKIEDLFGSRIHRGYRNRDKYRFDILGSVDYWDRFYSDTHRSWRFNSDGLYMRGSDESRYIGNLVRVDEEKYIKLIKSRDFWLFNYHACLYCSSSIYGKDYWERSTYGWFGDRGRVRNYRSKWEQLWRMRFGSRQHLSLSCEDFYNWFVDEIRPKHGSDSYLYLQNNFSRSFAIIDKGTGEL